MMVAKNKIPRLQKGKGKCQFIACAQCAFKLMLVMLISTYKRYTSAVIF